MSRVAKKATRLSGRGQSARLLGRPRQLPLLLLSARSHSTPWLSTTTHHVRRKRVTYSELPRPITGSLHLVISSRPLAGERCTGCTASFKAAELYHAGPASIPTRTSQNDATNSSGGEQLSLSLSICWVTQTHTACTAAARLCTTRRATRQSHPRARVPRLHERSSSHWARHGDALVYVCLLSWGSFAFRWLIIAQISNCISISCGPCFSRSSATSS